jgi:hypothetical protein
MNSVLVPKRTNMDPNANLKETLELAEAITAASDNEQPINEDDAVRLAELVIAMNEWMQKGGFCPTRWGVR